MLKNIDYHLPATSVVTVSEEHCSLSILVNY